MTKAWIVAIEKYAVNDPGSEHPPDLPGVCEWAVQLAEYLAACPATEIQLNLSPLEQSADGYRERLSAIGLAHHGATLAAIDAAIPRLKGNVDDTLLIYWMGHGVGSMGDRYLLFADSHGDDLKGLSVNGLLGHLRSRQFPGLQMGFIDACAEPFMRPSALQLNPGDAPARQFFYFAASVNEQASASREGAGFSSVILDHVKSAGVPSDPKPFFKDLEQTFDNLRRRGDLYSRPFELEFTFESGDQWTRTGQQGCAYLSGEARRAGLSFTQFEHLLREMRECPWINRAPREAAEALGEKIYDGPAEEQAAAVLSIAVSKDRAQALLEASKAHDPGHRSNENLAAAWQRVALVREFLEPCLELRLPSSDWKTAAARVQEVDFIENPGKTANLEELQLSVLNQTSVVRGRASFIRLLESAARIARRQNAAAADALVRRIKAHSDLGPLYDEAAGALASADDPVYLSLRLALNPNSNEYGVAEALARSTAGKLPNCGEIPHGGAASQIHELAQRFRLAYQRPLVIELLLPTKMLCYGREMLQIKDDELGDTFVESENAVVARWYERMANPEDKRYNPGNWKQASNTVRPHAEGVARLICRWTAPNAAAPAPGAACHVIGLEFPGPNEAGESNRQAFFSALKTGAPYMCWPRRSVEASPAAESHGLFDCPLHRLPHQLQEKKRGGALLDLILLMDDYGDNPYSKAS